MNYVFFLVLSVVVSNMFCLAIIVRRHVMRDSLGDGWAVTFVISLIAVVASIITLCNTTGWR